MQLLFLLIALFSFSFAQYDRFRYIDSASLKGTTNKNYIFRGNEPVQNKKMNYNFLVEGIKHGTNLIGFLRFYFAYYSAAKNASLKNFPEKFFIIDFNLLSIELRDWETEKGTFF